MYLLYNLYLTLFHTARTKNIGLMFFFSYQICAIQNPRRKLSIFVYKLYQTPNSARLSIALPKTNTEQSEDDVSGGVLWFGISPHISLVL